MIVPIILGRDAETAVADHGKVVMKPVTSREVSCNQLVKMGKPELGSWVGRLLYWCK